jgi:hypothetical protein
VIWIQGARNDRFWHVRTYLSCLKRQTDSGELGRLTTMLSDGSGTGSPRPQSSRPEKVRDGDDGVDGPLGPSAARGLPDRERLPDAAAAISSRMTTRRIRTMRGMRQPGPCRLTPKLSGPTRPSNLRFYKNRRGEWGPLQRHGRQAAWWLANAFYPHDARIGRLRGARRAARRGACGHPPPPARAPGVAYRWRSNEGWGAVRGSEPPGRVGPGHR